MICRLWSTDNSPRGATFNSPCPQLWSSWVEYTYGRFLLQTGRFLPLSLRPGCTRVSVRCFVDLRILSPDSDRQNVRGASRSIRKGYLLDGDASQPEVYSGSKNARNRR